MDVVIIGTGNAAGLLGKKISASEHRLLQVAGRTALHAARLGNQLEVSFTAEAALISREADIYIVAIADNALVQLHEWLKLDKKLVVHTAGSISKDVLKEVSKNYGVLYPLQSLHRELQHIPDIPFLVDGNTPDDLALIRDFAESLSGKVVVANDEVRQKIHLAAVMVNNFVNHLYTLAEAYCKNEKLDFSLLLPLIAETANRLHDVPAAKAQTGPAIRNDEATILKHLELLDKHPYLKEVYEFMTKSIQEVNKK